MAIRIEQTENFPERFQSITGDNKDELIQECLMRIRPHSREFYATNLKQDLDSLGESIIDYHAGCGTFYTVIFAPEPPSTPQAPREGRETDSGDGI